MELQGLYMTQIWNRLNEHNTRVLARLTSRFEEAPTHLDNRGAQGWPLFANYFFTYLLLISILAVVLE